MAVFLPLLMATVQAATLEGYVFREMDGGPPRRPVTVELLVEGSVRYRQTTGAGGAFTFTSVREGQYAIQARFAEFIIVRDTVGVVSGEKNFIAVMLPKRRAGMSTFGTVSARALAARSDAGMQKELRQAALLVASHDFDRAAQLYEQAVAQGALADVSDALGLLYQRMGRKADAYRAFQQAIERDPKYLLAYAHLGAAYLEIGQLKELAAVANRALAIDPNWLTGRLYLGEAQAGTGDLNAAARSAETAAGLAKGKAPAPELLLAKIRWAQRDCAAARGHMDRYLELNTSARRLPEVRKSLDIVRACKPRQ